MLRVSPFLLAASAAALPTTYLRPLERDLRDMEAEIKALNAKAAHKGLRLEKTNWPTPGQAGLVGRTKPVPRYINVQVVSQTHGKFSVQLPVKFNGDEFVAFPTIGELKAKIAEGFYFSDALNAEHSKYRMFSWGRGTVMTKFTPDNLELAKTKYGADVWARTQWVAKDSSSGEKELVTASGHLFAKWTPAVNTQTITTTKAENEFATVPSGTELGDDYEIPDFGQNQAPYQIDVEDDPLLGA